MQENTYLLSLVMVRHASFALWTGHCEEAGLCANPDLADPMMNQNENVFCANAESSIESGCSTIIIMYKVEKSSLIGC